MFDKPEDATGTQNSADLAHFCDGIWDAAQRPRGQGRVDGIVIEWRGLPIQSDELNRYRTCCNAFGREGRPRTIGSLGK